MGTVMLCGPVRRGCEPQLPDLQWPGGWSKAARLGPSTKPWGLSWPAAPVLRAGSPRVYTQPGRALISSPPTPGSGQTMLVLQASPPVGAIPAFSEVLPWDHTCPTTSRRGLRMLLPVCPEPFPFRGLTAASSSSY